MKDFWHVLSLSVDRVGQVGWLFSCRAGWWWGCVRWVGLGGARAKCTPAGSGQGPATLLPPSSLPSRPPPLPPATPAGVCEHNGRQGVPLHRHAVVRCLVQGPACSLLAGLQVQAVRQSAPKRRACPTHPNLNCLRARVRAVPHAVACARLQRYPMLCCAGRHPEKNAFEWTPDKDIPHHPDAIEVTQVRCGAVGGVGIRTLQLEARLWLLAGCRGGGMSPLLGGRGKGRWFAAPQESPAPSSSPPTPQEVANFFVGQARRNRHAPRSQAEEEELLIYNWAPTYTGKASRRRL